MSPLLFLESTEAPHSLQDTCLASLVETKDPPVEDTAVPPVPCGSRQCFLYPGPGGGYGFQLSCVASGRCVFISQVTDTSWAMDPINIYLLMSLPLELLQSLRATRKIFHGVLCSVSNLSTPFLPPLMPPGNPRRLSCPGRAAKGRCDSGGERVFCGWRE